MSKNIFLVLLILFIFKNSFSQFGSQQIITNEAFLARDVFTADIDGDGYLDVLSANRSLSSDFNIAWYKNLNGLGDFGLYNIIEDDLAEVFSVVAADIDNDGDVDVVATNFSTDLVIWYENLDSQGNFSTQKIISSNADGAFDVITIDIDGDGDMDVVSASDFSGIAWYENLDGQGNFSSEIFIANTGNNRSVFAGDIDDDGDLDLVGSSSGNVIVYWFENLDGQGNFSSPKSIAPVNPPTSTSAVFAIDLDGDADLDVLAIPENKQIVWYENLDGQGAFGEEQVIISDLISSISLFSTDLDNDGDNDVLYTSTPSPIENTSEIGWLENLDGLGSFSSKQIIINTLTFATKVFSDDIDNDGDMDVLSASQNDDTIAWYENFTILGIEESTIEDFTIYPNPTSAVLNINNNNIEINKIEIYDALGKKVWVKTGNTTQIDVSSFNSGLYLVNIQTDQGTFFKKIVKE